MMPTSVNVQTPQYNNSVYLKWFHSVILRLKDRFIMKSFALKFIDDLKNIIYTLSEVFNQNPADLEMNLIDQRLNQIDESNVLK